jgi:hypothetical protein
VKVRKGRNEKGLVAARRLSFGLIQGRLFFAYLSGVDFFLMVRIIGVGRIFVLPFYS